jgi:hypothetical protein
MERNLNRGTPPDPRWADALGGYVNNTRYIHHEHLPNASAHRAAWACGAAGVLHKIEILFGK